MMKKILVGLLVILAVAYLDAPVDAAAHPRVTLRFVNHSDGEARFRYRVVRPNRSVDSYAIGVQAHSVRSIRKPVRTGTRIIIWRLTPSGWLKVYDKRAGRLWDGRTVAFVTRTSYVHPVPAPVQPPPPPPGWGAGTWLVHTEIAPGTYYADANGHCYWERLSDLSGSFDAIIDNEFWREGRGYVTIQPTDVAFRISGDCRFMRYQ